MKSFPMLDTRFAADIVRESVEQSKTIEALAKESSTSHPKTRNSETGLSCASESELQGLRDEILLIAKRYGYPERPLGSAVYSSFDREATHVLIKRVDAPVNDARSTELWNFLTTVLLLDVASWRFKNEASNPAFQRYLGTSSKSTFKKLWWRGFVLGAYSDLIGEDQAVALLERTSIAGDPRLPKKIIKEFTEYASGSSTNAQNSAQFRAVMVLTKARLRTLCVEALSDEQVDELVQDSIRAICAR